jgi:hypothetical protein
MKSNAFVMWSRWVWMTTILPACNRSLGGSCLLSVQWGWIGPTPKPPPTSRVTARGVDCRWNSTNDYSTPHYCHKPLLMWWIRGGGAMGVKTTWKRTTNADKWPGPPAPRPHNNNGQHTTCPQPYKQLLMGWIVGGVTRRRSHNYTRTCQRQRHTAGRGTRRRMVQWGKGTTINNTPPTSSLMSNCLWGEW